MADTINGVERYAGVSVNTSFGGMDSQFDRLVSVNLSLGDASTAATAYVAAPANGKLKAAYLVDNGGAATVDVTITNKSNDNASMVGVTNITTVADTAYDLSGDVSAANADVSAGDLIEVNVAQAGGVCSMVLYFENN